MLKEKTTIMILCLSSLAGHTFAMQSIHDEDLAEVTAQDGLTIQLVSPSVTIDKILLHDNDGLQPINGNPHGIITPSAGAMIVNDFALIPQNPNIPLLSMVIDADGGVSGAAPMLNVMITLAPVELDIGSIAVGSSEDDMDGTTARRGVSDEVKIIDGFSLKLSQMTFNIQLGHRAQDHLMQVYGTIEDGVRISDFGILANGSTNI